MAEQPQEQPRPRDVMIRTAASELVSLAMMGAVLWYFGPGRIWVAVQRARVAAAWHGHRGTADLDVAQFCAQLSADEHERLGR